MKQESQRRPRSAWSPVRSVTSSTVVQKQVGQTIVQLPQVRQRAATSSQRGCSALRVEQLPEVDRVERRGPSALRRARATAPARARSVAGGRRGAAPRRAPRRPARSRPRPGSGAGRRRAARSAPGRSRVSARRPGAHRDAEAGGSRVAAAHRDDEGVGAADWRTTVCEPPAPAARCRGCPARAGRTRRRARRTAPSTCCSRRGSTVPSWHRKPAPDHLARQGRTPASPTAHRWRSRRRPSSRRRSR